MSMQGSPVSAEKPSFFDHKKHKFNDFNRRIKMRFWEFVLDLALNKHPDASGNYVSYAEEELKRAGWYDKDAFYGDMMPKAVLRAVKLHGIEGHSGMSNGIAVNIIESICRFEPLTPLTGEDDEWNEVGSGVFQNRRKSDVFKESDGKAYWSNGRIFRDPNGVTYTSRDSRVEIEFPWNPTKAEIVDVDKDGNPV